MECIFRGIKFSIEESVTPKDCLSKETQQERIRFEKPRRERITPVLCQKDQDFPDSLHEAAGSEHRHYDTVSLAIVSAIVVMSAAPFFGQTDLRGSWAKAVLFWIPGFIDVLLLLAYVRAAQTARIARRTMRAIEIGFDRRGFSANYGPKRFFVRLSLPLFRAVLFMSGFLIVVLFLIGTLVFAGWLECSLTWDSRILCPTMVHTEMLGGC